MTQRYRRDIDGLRSIAILSVVLYHFHIPIAEGGFVGVDIFFVISGFVITGSVLTDIDAKTFSIRNFYFKRIRRIFPAYIAMMAASTAAAFILLLPDDFQAFGASLLASSLFCSNIYFWKTSGYFAPAAHDKPLLHTWSLSVEEQFYIFAPLLIYAIHRFGSRRWGFYIVPLSVLSLVASVAAVFVAPTAGFFLLPTRAWELLLGVLICTIGNRVQPSFFIRQAISSIGGMMIISGIIILDSRSPFPGWFALLPCLGTAFVIHSGRPEAGDDRLPWVNRLLATRLPVGIGLISYSLYLFHWPIAAFVRYETLRDPTLLEAGLMLGVSLILSWASWRFLEQPTRHILPIFQTKVLYAGAVVVPLGGIAGLTILTAQGFPQRFPDFVEQKIPGVGDWGSCFHQDPTTPIKWNGTSCTRVHGPNGRILVWGDSFAAHYMPGILRDTGRIGADVLQYTFAGCPPILAYFSYARIGCTVSNRQVLDVIKKENVDTVVIVARWGEVPRVALAKFPETISALNSLGVKVYVIGQSPEFGADVQHIDFISGQKSKTGDVDWMTSADNRLNTQLAELAKGATFINPLLFLCSGVQCAYRRDHDFLYADYGHFSTSGSLRAVQAYFPSGRLNGAQNAPTHSVTSSP